MPQPSASDFSYSASWTPARTRKKRKSKTQAPLSPSEQLQCTLDELLMDALWMADCEQLVQRALSAQPWKTPPDILCLGLGSPTASRDARAQLALLLTLSDRLCIDRSKITAFDPVFTPADRDLLEALGMCTIEDNKHAKHRLETPTLLYMPHCDAQLYENLLRTNWSSRQLGCSVFFANDFAEYADNIPSRKFASAYPCLHRLQSRLHRSALPLSSNFSSAFNNLAIQWIDVAALPPRVIAAAEATATCGLQERQIGPSTVTTQDCLCNPFWRFSSSEERVEGNQGSGEVA